MIKKTENKIRIMKQGGDILSRVITLLFESVGVGISMRTLDRIAREEIIKSGGEPSFEKVKGYKWAICACINDTVVHGVPTDYKLKKGDYVGIDTGVYFKGYHTDTSWTFILDEANGKPAFKEDEFLKTGRQALINAINTTRSGVKVWDISKAIQDTVEAKGYSIARGLVGHGVGRKLHEEPSIPGIVMGIREKSPEITEGMTLALEVIYNMGKSDIIIGKDNWTISTRDGRISGLFEATVAVTSHGCIILSPKGSLFDFNK